MAHILITGGCGFIGRHVALALKAAGDEVSVLDDLSSSAEPPLGVTFHQGDIRDDDLLARLAAKVDGIIHLAAIASVDQSTQRWTHTHGVNAGGTVAVLNAARARRVPVVYASSAAIYGDQGKGKIAESAIAKPLSAYGVDKLSGEAHARVAGRIFGLPSMGLRFFNVYGPGQNPNSPYSGVISRFIALALAGQPLTLNGNGTQVRDFVYVGDVVAAILTALAHANASAPVVNICTGRPQSIVGLANQINRLCDNRATHKWLAPRPGDIQHSVGDGGKARQGMGFEAVTGS